jgi:O-antigen ligase
MIRYSVQKLFNLNGVFIVIVAAFGMFAGLLALLFTRLSVYRMIFVVFALLFFPACLALTRSITRAFLAALIFAIPLGFSLSLFGRPILYRGMVQPAIVLYLYDLPLMGVVALWIREVFFTRRKSAQTPGILLMAVFWIMWSVLSIYNSENLRASWFEILRMIKLCITMLAVSTLVREKQDIRVLFIALFMSLMLQSFICIVQYITGSFFNLEFLGMRDTGELSRVSGTMNWPNTAGAFLATLTSMALILFFSNADTKMSILSLTSAFAGFISLIMTFSRGAWISFFTALFIGILIALAMKWLSPKSVFRLAVIGLVILVSIAFFSQVIQQRLDQSGANQGPVADRILLNKIAENMITSHPVLGVGVNTFVDVMRKYDTTGISYTLRYPVHNAYLFIASETGLVGLGFFLVFTGTIFGLFFQAVKSRDRFISVSAICMISGMVVILVSNLGDVHLMTDQIFPLFWCFAGLGIAILRIKQTQEKLQALG